MCQCAVQSACVSPRLLVVYLFCIHVDLNAIMGGQYSRLFLSKTVFDTMGQAFVALLMFYSFRQLERQIGSKKFGAFVVLMYALSTLLEVAVATVCFSLQFRVSIENGPYFLIFSMLPMFYCT
jgi:hypothetical protein